MTNEQLALKIQAGETHLMGKLWEQSEGFVFQQAGKFYKQHFNRCKSLGIEFEDLTQEAYLALYEAVKNFDAEKGYKLLTYARFHFIKRFYAALGLHRATRKYTEVSFDVVAKINANGDYISLLDILADETAETEFENIAEQDYLSKVTPILQAVLNDLSNTQRETALTCFGRGLSYAEYARQKGVSKATTSKAAKRALNNLRANADLMACAY